MSNCSGEFTTSESAMMFAELEDIQFKLGISLPSLKKGLFKAHRLSAEVEEGNREYKFKLTDLTDEQLTHRTTQLNWRLNEGNGIAFYQLGVEDNGNPLGLSAGELQESLANLKSMADNVGCEMAIDKVLVGERGFTAEVQMKRRERLTISTAQVMVAVAGNENSGKSTMIGVLCTGKRDNGKGLARAQVFTHDHEIATGRTSSISYHSIHFNKMGEILNSDATFTAGQLNEIVTGTSSMRRLRALSDVELADETERNVILVDLAGRTKYFKTTLRGLVGRRPNHNLVCVSAVAGLQSMTIEHIGISLYLKVPLAIIITKVDLLTRGGSDATKGTKKRVHRKANYYSAESSTADGVKDEENKSSTKELTDIETLLRSIQQLLAGTQRDARLISRPEELQELLEEQREILNATSTPPVRDVKSDINQLKPLSLARGSSASSTASTLDSKLPVPVFLTSNVTGEGLPLVISYLYNLPHHEAQQRSLSKEQPVRVRIMGSMGRIEEEEEPAQCQHHSPNLNGSNKVVQQTPLWRYTYRKASDELCTSELRNGKDVEAANEYGNEHSRTAGEQNRAISSDEIIPPIPSPRTDANNTMPPMQLNSAAPDTVTHFLQHTRRPSSNEIMVNELSDFVEPLEGKVGAAYDQSVERSETVGSFSRDASTSSFLSRTSSRVSMNSANDNQNNLDSPIFSQNPSKGRKVLIGSIECGRIAIGDKLLLGPTSQGLYLPVSVTSLRVNNVRVQYAAACQTITFKLKELAMSDIEQSIGTFNNQQFVSDGVAMQGESSNHGVRKRVSAAGLTLLPLYENDSICGPLISSPPSYWEFEAELLVLNHPSTIRLNYEPVVHISCIQQTAKIVSIQRALKSSSDDEEMPCSGSNNHSDARKEGSVAESAERGGSDDPQDEKIEVGNGERAICRFRFLYYPEYILPGESMIIREQSTRGVGTVTAVW